MSSYLSTILSQLICYLFICHLLLKKSAKKILQGCCASGNLWACEEWTASQKISPQSFAVWGIARRGQNPQSDINFPLDILTTIHHHPPMSDVLKIIDNLTNNLWAKFGNPLAKYKQTQNDVHMTYYVGRLMEELGHKWIRPSQIKGDHENRAYYSESALHDAFLAGQLIARAENKETRSAILSELKAEISNFIEEYH